MGMFPNPECGKYHKTVLLLSRAQSPRKSEASQTFPANLSDFRRNCVGNRNILLQMKF